MQRVLAAVSCLLLLAGCWADFPDELVEPDGPGQTDGGTDGLQPADTVPWETKPLLSLGTSCVVDSECFSDHCADGVCCNLDCKQECHSCQVSGKEGQCLPVPAGEDPDDDCTKVEVETTCGFDGTCDGRGACRRWPAGTLCLVASCGGAGKENIINQARFCDGKGGCKDTGTLDCAPYRCNPADARCFSSCTSGSQCFQTSCVTTSNKCDGQSQPLGTGCAAAGQCQSGKCVDGVCCATDCGGTCQTCNLQVSSVLGSGAIAGTCIDVPDGLDPGNDCQPGATPCGLDGECDGAGACRTALAGTPCKEVSCKDGELLPFSFCDGAGNCQVNSPVSCGAYVCEGTLGCYGQCSSDAQCAAGKTCANKTCN
jgi:hypothetical protein